MNEPFKPKRGDTFWLWVMEKDQIYATNSIFYNNRLDLNNIVFGNCFRSQMECLAHTEIRDKYLAMRKEYEV